MFKLPRRCCLCLVTITKTLRSRSFTYVQPFHVAPLLKHDMSRIRKQEGSCPVMCVWLSAGCCKQAEEMWMWLTLPDWLSVLAWGYKHAFPVIYRCGVVSHKASGWGRQRERAKQQYLIQVWQIFCRKSIQTAPSNLSDPLVLPLL